MCRSDFPKIESKKELKMWAKKNAINFIFIRFSCKTEQKKNWDRNLYLKMFRFHEITIILFFHLINISVNIFRVDFITGHVF